MAPGECYYYLNFSRYKIGMLIHLVGVLPASLIAVTQFMPVIRRRWMIVHRVGGYVSLILYLFSIFGAFMIARRSFGGGLDVQSFVGVAGFGSLSCFAISYINIKRLQIEQHRAWMLRGWFYAGSIVTSRFITAISAQIIANQGYYIVWTCAKIADTISKDVNLATSYPSCAAYANGTDPEAVSAVAAKFAGGNIATIGAALNVVFGMALWVSLALHAVGVEVYLYLTPSETKRLREISYQKQIKAGMRNPDSSDLSAHRLGGSYKRSPRATPESNMASSVYGTIAPDSRINTK
ncbi:hypothetical protein ACJQWK_06740 [Exserohilum turcicum]